MKDELNRLSRFRPQIETLVYAAERGDLRREPDPARDEWLGQLRDAVEEADNVLDELEYRHLKEEADEGRGKWSKTIVKFAVRAAQQDDVLKRLREVVKTFDNLVAGLSTFAQILSGFDRRSVTEVKRDMGRETASLFTEKKLFGRENEQQTVMCWFKKCDTEIFSVFSIVGVGGVGKTALAQFLFENSEVHFDIKMWVCVSNSFEEKAITMKMLESLTNIKPKFDTLDAAQRTLKENITGKKFLLVLDDVWNDKERERWNKLMAPLKFGGEGSKILLTTRMESVADTVANVVGETKMSFKLNGLEELDNVLLFEKYAFAGYNPNEYARLRSIGIEVARKLRGIPLAVKAVGGMLNSRLEEEYWSRVFDDGALNSDKGTDGIMAAIRLSYEHLPLELKPCFRYCSIFFQDYEFKREKLVDMWISVGLIPGDEKGQEELANEYFETLVRKSFFEPKFSYFNRPYFNMHDLLHDLAQVLSKNECLQVVSNDTIIIPQSIRHLSLTTNNILVLKNLSGLKYLRTLLLFCDVEDVGLASVINTALKELKTIRYLQLFTDVICDFPKSIGDLVHLRCLSMTTDIPKLSPCICKLYHLQILEFEWMDIYSVRKVFPKRKEKSYSSHPSEQSIPADICKLSKLKRLSLPTHDLSTIPHIGKLSSLQQLIGYRVKGEAGYDISELEMMSELHELKITNLENVKSTEESSKAQLNSKQLLRRIELKWDNGFENIRGRNVSDKDVADCLQPHPNLTNLLLNGYRGTSLPNWLTPQFLPNLTAINLAHCSSLERLPPIGQLPYLKILTLEKLGALKVIGLEFYGSSQSGNTFPALETLELKRLIKLEAWREDTKSEKWLPCLKRLVVEDCPSLKKLPPIPTALKQLYLYYLEIATLPEFKQKNEGCSTNQGFRELTSLFIFLCPKLTSLKSGFFMHPEQLASLKELQIYKCDELVFLPSEGFRELISLKTLEIVYCRRLFLLPMLLPKNFFPPSVQWLILKSCGDLAASIPQFLLDLSLLYYLELTNCANLISLPSANVLQSFTSLKKLQILNCERLKSLGGLEAIPSLKDLVIRQCPMLATNSSLVPIEELPRNRLSMALNWLELDEPDLLLVVPLRNLHLTKLLMIRGRLSTMLLLLDQWFVQNRASLQSLYLYGTWEVHFIFDLVEKLPSLRVLSLWNVYSLMRLPALPISLESLYIDGCNEELAGRLEEGGLDYDKIRNLDVRVLGVKSQSEISQLFS